MQTLLFFLFVIAVVIAYRYGVHKGMERQRAMEMHYPTKAATYYDSAEMAKEISSFLYKRLYSAKPLAWNYRGEYQDMRDGWVTSQHSIWARCRYSLPSEHLIDLCRYVYALGCRIELRQVEDENDSPLKSKK